jgi:polysaccharide biosynthesis transport protein
LLRRRARLILGIALAAAVLAFVVSSLLPDKYDASSDVLFRQPAQTPKVNVNEPQEVSSEPERIAATNLALASLDQVAFRVAKKIETDKSPEELRDSVTIQPKGQADVVTITARADSPEEAAEIANAFANQVVAVRKQSAKAKIEQVVDAIRTQLDEVPMTPAVSERLGTRVSQLEVQARLETGDAEVVEQALPPESPASPKPLRNAVIGFLLGLILGVVLALLLRRFDRSVGSDEEIVEITGAPVVGRIPVIDETGWKHGMALESFQFLRANLQLRSATAAARTIAVTSALPEEGKSTIALRFSQALALSGSTVILVDCDIRRPMLHALLGVPGDPGVTNALSSPEDTERFLKDTAMDGVRLLPAGPLTALPGTLLTDNHDLGKLIGDVAGHADYVIVDTAPVTIGADASTVASEVDATLLVVDTATVDQRLLMAAAEQLHHAEASIAGVVLNRSEGLLSNTAYQGYYAAAIGEVAAHVPPPINRTAPPEA